MRITPTSQSYCVCSAQFSCRAVPRENNHKTRYTGQGGRGLDGCTEQESLQGTSQVPWGPSPGPSLNPEAPEKASTPAPSFSDEETEPPKGVVTSRGHSLAGNLTPSCPGHLLARPASWPESSGVSEAQLYHSFRNMGQRLFFPRIGVRVRAHHVAGGTMPGPRSTARNPAPSLPPSLLPSVLSP